MAGTMIKLSDGTAIHVFESPFYGWVAVHYTDGLAGEEIARRRSRGETLRAVDEYMSLCGHEIAQERLCGC